MKAENGLRPAKSGKTHSSAARTAAKSGERNVVETPKQDIETVTADGESIQRLIEGVKIIPAVTHADERGTLCQISSLALKGNPSPIVYVYQFTIRPGKVKGWHVHHLHDDRIFISQGTVKVVLYDARPDSPTFGMINEIYRAEHHLTLMVIPAYVFHAHHNVGHTDALFVSMPTRVYNHQSPDVYRLPLENQTIPYHFEERMGW